MKSVSELEEPNRALFLLLRRSSRDSNLLQTGTEIRRSPREVALSGEEPLSRLLGGTNTPHEEFMDPTDIGAEKNEIIMKPR
ncbi:hypothetical protein TNIN_176261 [Trichonephila inaurata madagascariensis]|uniref:Uncharacterized protein n=1 Tax=Trichonephila inaurata madagascariensis TaxID=2747483 RepID=A0A8X7CSU2_9ARAC|nr:hypothetical protein TNIN_176261 [Trichonephila inaurata madagascariensis]